MFEKVSGESLNRSWGVIKDNPLMVSLSNHEELNG
jgi:hypothetical protein